MRCILCISFLVQYRIYFNFRFYVSNYKGKQFKIFIITKNIRILSLFKNKKRALPIGYDSDSLVCRLMTTFVTGNIPHICENARKLQALIETF